VLHCRSVKSCIHKAACYRFRTCHSGYGNLRSLPRQRSLLLRFWQARVDSTS
jgi:hypothetical protein